MRFHVNFYTTSLMSPLRPQVYANAVNKAEDLVYIKGTRLGRQMFAKQHINKGATILKERSILHEVANTENRGWRHIWRKKT
jgi:hypothetical protein